MDGLMGGRMDEWRTHSLYSLIPGHFTSRDWRFNVTRFRRCSWIMIKGTQTNMGN